MLSIKGLHTLTLSTVLALAAGLTGCAKQESQTPTKVLFAAGKMSHAFNNHEHNAGAILLAKALNESGLGIEASVNYNKDNPGWTMDESALEGIDAVVIYCDGGDKHLSLIHISEPTRPY